MSTSTGQRPTSGSGHERAQNGTTPKSTSFPIKRPIGSREVIIVANIDDPVKRNLLITMSYGDLAMETDCLLGHRNLNWCAFGTWASKTAGNTIRKELPILPVWLSHIVSKLPLIRRRMQNCSEKVAEGNQKVFAELGPFFADMVETFKCDHCPDMDKFDEFAHRIRASKEREGEDFKRVVRGFREYYRAMFEEDLDKKAEHIFFGNCLIALHEQMRLQPQIADALKLGFRTEFFRRLWHWFATRYFMRIELGERKLWLGRNVKVRMGRRNFSPELEELENKDLRIFLMAIDKCSDTLNDSGAKNWARLADRMRFITKLFRSHQRDRSLLDCPFTPSEQWDLTHGNVPKKFRSAY